MYKFLIGKPDMGYIGVDDRIILKYILNELCVKLWVGFIGFKTGRNRQLLNWTQSLKLDFHKRRCVFFNVVIYS
jgi:hypothetical protein